MDCKNLTYIEAPNLTNISDIALDDCSSLTHIELPNLTTVGYRLLQDCESLRSIECPKLTPVSDGHYYGTGSSSASSPNYFIDLGTEQKLHYNLWFYTRVLVLRADTVSTGFTQSRLSDPVLYIVPSALVDTYKSKVRSKDFVTALEKSPFADGKTVCGNNMKTYYYRGMDGETVDLGEGTMLKYYNVFDNWNYESTTNEASLGQIARAPENAVGSGFYFLSKLTKEQGYTVPT